MQLVGSFGHAGSAVPAATELHVPRLPETLHALQVPQDDWVVQHTPSVQ
jgi:hypothetical protein